MKQHSSTARTDSSPDQSIEMEAVKTKNIPQHIAIIMDGNGRWAAKQELPRSVGHQTGAQAVRDIVTQCRTIGVKALTLYAFSAQNWGRPAEEVQALMSLLAEFVQKEKEEILENNIRLVTIGDITRLPSYAITPLEELISLTRDNTGMILCLALSYGSREELTRTVRMLAHQIADQNIKPEEIDENAISAALDTNVIPWDPDLIIRTGGEQRLSNFLLWQSAYAELYFSDTLWPAFTKEELEKALTAYGDRQRRFGLLADASSKRNDP